MQLTSLLALFLVVSCVPAAPAQQEKPPAESKGLTGAVSEEEFKALHEIRGDKAPPPKGQMVTIGTQKHYLSLPAGQPPFPAIVVIHEWYGLNDHIKHWADRLAADGYAALAVDLYGGKVATSSDAAMKAMKAVDPAEATKTLLEAHRFLASDERIRATRRASLGWCFGGAQSLQLALNATDLDAAVIYYGRLVTDPSKLKTIKARVCGVFGNKDASIPPATVDAFDEALKTAGVEHEIWRYDAEHAFANPSGSRYDTQAATDAWSKVRGFLAKHLKQG